MLPRARQLEQAFGTIASTRMAGLPKVHPGLRVEAIGFELHRGPDGEAGWLGALLTPWCMNLVWLPEPAADGHAAIRLGVGRDHALRGNRYTFLGAH
jgi:[NiFe] hydrogenase assembly HybE family chaperone